MIVCLAPDGVVEHCYDNVPANFTSIMAGDDVYVYEADRIDEFGETEHVYRRAE